MLVWFIGFIVFAQLLEGVKLIYCIELQSKKR